MKNFHMLIFIWFKI